jgi:hypothetical protein
VPQPEESPPFAFTLTTVDELPDGRQLNKVLEQREF